MPRHFLLCLLAIFIVTGCDQDPPPQKGKKGKQVVVPKPYPEDKEFVPDIPPAPAPYIGPIKYCFEKKEGENGEDVTTLHIVLDHDSINGTLDFMPYQRPATHGTVEGISLGRIFSLIYRYKQDTVSHAEQIIYKFDNNKLYLKEGNMVEQDGIMVLENPVKSTFVLYMDRVDCK